MFKRDKKNLGIVEQGLLDLLGECSTNECCWDCLAKFIDYVQVREAQIKSGQLIEERLIAGTYPCTMKVEKFDWDSLRETLLMIKEGIKQSE